MNPRPWPASLPKKFPPAFPSRESAPGRSVSRTRRTRRGPVHEQRAGPARRRPQPRVSARAPERQRLSYLPRSGRADRQVGNRGAPAGAARRGRGRLSPPRRLSRTRRRPLGRARQPEHRRARARARRCATAAPRTSPSRSGRARRRRRRRRRAAPPRLRAPRGSALVVLARRRSSRRRTRRTETAHQKALAARPSRPRGGRRRRALPNVKLEARAARAERLARRRRRQRARRRGGERVPPAPQRRRTPRALRRRTATPGRGAGHPRGALPIHFSISSSSPPRAPRIEARRPRRARRGGGADGAAGRSAHARNPRGDGAARRRRRSAPPGTAPPAATAAAPPPRARFGRVPVRRKRVRLPAHDDEGEERASLGVVRRDARRRHQHDALGGGVAGVLSSDASLASRNAAYDFTPAAPACAKDSSRARRAAPRAARVLRERRRRLLARRRARARGSPRGGGKRDDVPPCAPRLRQRPRRRRARRVGGAGAERRACLAGRAWYFLDGRRVIVVVVVSPEFGDRTEPLGPQRAARRGRRRRARRGGARVETGAPPWRAERRRNARFRSRARAPVRRLHRDAQGEAEGPFAPPPPALRAEQRARRPHAALRAAASDRLLPSSAASSTFVFRRRRRLRRLDASLDVGGAASDVPPNTLPAATSSATPAALAVRSRQRMGDRHRAEGLRAARGAPARRAVSRADPRRHGMSPRMKTSASRPTQRLRPLRFLRLRPRPAARPKGVRARSRASVPVAGLNRRRRAASLRRRQEQGRARSRSARRASSVEFVLSRDEKSAETSEPQLTRVAKSSREVVAPASNPSSSRSASNPPEDSDSKTSGLPKHATSTPGTRRASRHTAASARATPSAPSSGDLICTALLSAARTQTRRVCRNTLSARSALRSSTATSAASASATSSARLAFEFV